MRRVVILVHCDGALDDSNYFLHEMARFWKEDGIGVIVQRGPGPRHEADLAILHVDLTVVPDDHLQYLRQYSRVINGAVSDISKRRISRLILRRGERYDGPAIVKTNCNSGGLREARLARRWRGQRFLARVRRKLPWAMRAELPTDDYPTFEHASQIPLAAWCNPDLVVERFVAEQREGLYCLRTWVFFGDRETNSLSYSRSPIVKAASVVRREVVSDVPGELREMRKELGFDFGKFDYGIVDGRVVLYDANRTPALGNFPREQFLPRVRLLAEGIGCFF